MAYINHFSKAQAQSQEMLTGQCWLSLLVVMRGSGPQVTDAAAMEQLPKFLQMSALAART